MVSNFHHLARAIIMKEDQVLLVQTLGEEHTFLPGGHIEFGESATDALIREIQEELGVDCSIVCFLGLVEHKWEHKGKLNCEINQVFEVDCPYLYLGENPTSKESHLEFFWSAKDDLGRYNLEPYPLRDLIMNFNKGDLFAWWKSTLND